MMALERSNLDRMAVKMTPMVFSEICKVFETQGAFFLELIHLTEFICYVAIYEILMNLVHFYNTIPNFFRPVPQRPILKFVEIITCSLRLNKKQPVN